MPENGNKSIRPPETGSWGTNASWKAHQMDWMAQQWAMKRRSGLEGPTKPVQINAHWQGNHRARLGQYRGHDRESMVAVDKQKI